MPYLGRTYNTNLERRYDNMRQTLKTNAILEINETIIPEIISILPSDLIVELTATYRDELHLHYQEKDSRPESEPYLLLFIGKERDHYISVRIYEDKITYVHAPPSEEQVVKDLEEAIRENREPFRRLFKDAQRIYDARTSLTLGGKRPRTRKTVKRRTGKKTRRVRFTKKN